MAKHEQAGAGTTNVELVDVTHRDGNPTGEQLDKHLVHRRGLWHRDMHVWITDGERMLQQQRVWHKKIMPGAWDISVGGHVSAGESFLEAALRETPEEIGLSFAPERYIPAGKTAVEMLMEPGPNAWMHRTAGEHFVVVERNLDLGALTLQASEVIDARLYPIDRLEDDLRSPDTASRHAPQPLEMWQLGIAAMRHAAELD